jgi:GDPmannose 4,6-dehydratase
MKIKWKGKNENEIGIYENKEIIKVDKSYYRPTEVDSLLGDASKAKKKVKMETKNFF